MPVAKVPDPQVNAWLYRHAQECALPAPAWHEMVFGCSRLPLGRRRTELEVYLAEVVAVAFQCLTYDQPAADWHGRERARLESLGRPAQFVDGQIAAIAVSNGLTLITRNLRDFASFEGLAAAEPDPVL